MRHAADFLSFTLLASPALAGEARQVPRGMEVHTDAGETVRVVIAGDLAAVVGTVGLDEFGEQALRRHLEDLDWLSAKATAHDAVISAIARFGSVILVRLATVTRMPGSLSKLKVARNG